MNPADAGILGLALTSMLLLMLAWLIGVQGALSLISNYRRKPEDFPDGAGLGRWIARVLAAGGVSFGLCALALAGDLISVQTVGPWSAGTGTVVAAFALGGIGRFRRRAPPGAERRGAGRDRNR